MKKLVALLVTLMFVGGFAWVGAGMAQGGPPVHPHMLVLGLELDGDGEPVGFRKCVDLAAGQALPLNAHHAHAHTGRAGNALATRAGHFVVPGSPLTEWENCSDLMADFAP